MANKAKIKVGIVGLGKMGIMHACLLNTFSNVSITALCDKSRIIRAIARQPFPEAVITENLAKFQGLNLDAVFVLTPIPIHYHIIKQIYEQKISKNIFVEKTLTSSYEQSDELATISKRNGGITMVGYMKRFGVTFKHAEILLSQQILGDLTSFHAYAFSSDFVSVKKDSTAIISRGGVLEDLGSHVVDLSVWLFGNLRVTSATINSQIYPNSEGDISFTTDGIDGMKGKFDVSWRKYDYRMPEFGITINGTKGRLSVNDDEVRLELKDAPTKRWYRADMNDNVDFLLSSPEYWREDKHFLDSLIAGKETECSFKDSLKVDFLLESVRRMSK